MTLRGHTIFSTALMAAITAAACSSPQSTDGAGATSDDALDDAVMTTDLEPLGSNVNDPGPRTKVANAGGAFPGLNADELAYFEGSRDTFGEVDSVSGALEEGSGLGPTFNSNSCSSCHAQPDVGGSSPHPTLGVGAAKVPNPQVALATLDRVKGGNQRVPSFITANGPVREARFIRNADGTLDGGVHGLYTIAGRSDAPGCVLPQPDFDAELAANNVIFRIPTPVFGLGLVENVSDDALVANLNANRKAKAALGIAGALNRSGNDGTVTRFGWKAQNKSLLIFAGEAYNVEQGVANEIFPNERSAVDGCTFNAGPEDSTSLVAASSVNEASGDTVQFAAFMRLSAPPTATTSTASERHGKALFGTAADPGIGCVHCHSETLHAGKSKFTGMSDVDIHPYSDFAIHHMGPRLADHVNQGGAGLDDFRSAPLWGLGQRIFFLHDGRATPDNGGIVRAILEHESSNPRCFPGQKTRGGIACDSEANAVIRGFRKLRASDQQDLVNFLRSL